MIDLEGAGRRLISGQGREPTPTAALQRRARARRRRRLTVVSVAAVAVLAAATGVGLAAGGGRRVQLSVVGPATGGAHPGGSVALRLPRALAVASDGDLLIDNVGSDQILRRSPHGALSVLAGAGRPGYSGDGGPAVRARLNQPSGVAVAPDGAVYVADTANNRVREISPDGTITTVAGDGTTGGPTAGDPRRAAVAQPESVAVGPAGQLYVVDNVGVQVLAGGALRTVSAAGPGKLTIRGTPTAWFPGQIAVSTRGDLYITGTSPKLVVELTPAGRLLHTWTSYASQLAAGPRGSVLVADYGDFALDRISSGGTLRHVVTFRRGSGIGPFRPSGVAATSDGTVYLADDGVTGGTPVPSLLQARPRHPPQLINPTPTTSK